MKNRTLPESFRNAFRGLRKAFAGERNLRIHLAAAFLCILLGIILRLDLLRWCLIFTAIGLVFTAELVNTAVENLVDMITDEYSRKAGMAKDIAAAAVLVAAVTAAVLGVLVFGPSLMRFAGII